MKRTPLVSTALLLILALILAACGGGDSMAAAPSPSEAGDAAAGEKVFAMACASCHGPKGEGVPGLSKDMTQSQFTASQTDPELFEFIKTGRTSGDASPTTDVVMPPKGGVPLLTDQNLVDVVAYIRSLNK